MSDNKPETEISEMIKAAMTEFLHANSMLMIKSSDCPCCSCKPKQILEEKK